MNTNNTPTTPRQEYDQAERHFFHQWRSKRGLTEEDMARPDRDDLRRLYAEARDKNTELKRLKAALLEEGGGTP